MVLEGSVEEGKAELELDELDGTDNDAEAKDELEFDELDDTDENFEANADDVVESSASSIVVPAGEPDSAGEKAFSGELVDAVVDTDDFAESSVFEKTVTGDIVVGIADSRFDEVGKSEVFGELKDTAVVPPSAMD